MLDPARNYLAPKERLVMPSTKAKLTASTKKSSKSSNSTKGIFRAARKSRAVSAKPSELTGFSVTAKSRDVIVPRGDKVFLLGPMPLEGN